MMEFESTMVILCRVLSQLCASRAVSASYLVFIYSRRVVLGWLMFMINLIFKTQTR